MEGRQHRLSEPILRSSLAKEFEVGEDEVEVKGFEVSAGTAKGDNFATEMKLVRVEAVVGGKEVKKNYMVKTMPMSEFREKMLKAVRYA